MTERDEFEEKYIQVKVKERKTMVMINKKVMKKITSSSTSTKPLITLAVLPEIKHEISVAVDAWVMRPPPYS